MTVIAAASYETDWFKVIVNVVIAVIVARGVDLFIGAAIALQQIPAVDTLARAMLASAAVVAGLRAALLRRLGDGGLIGEGKADGGE
jgi:hypothetical protein